MILYTNSPKMMIKKAPILSISCAISTAVLYVRYANSDNGSFCANTDTLNEERNGNEQSDKHETSHDTSLGAVLIRCERGDEKDNEVSEASNKIRPSCSTHRRDILVRIVGIVSVQHQQGHDPEDDQALQQVIGIVRVHDLTKISPDVPCRRKDEYVLCQVSAVGMLSELIAEVGDNGDV
ncbi:hypothetical protein HG530_012980 [Fusarium avenaceum]|nr:hypothetical protein HG530_012980 [Fusarium avenaceum]